MPASFVNLSYRYRDASYLEHISQRSTQSMVDEAKVKVAPLFDERSDGSVVRRQG